MENSTFQELVRRAAQNKNWASYYLLFQVCQTIIDAAPKTLEQLNERDPAKAWEQAMECLGETITQVVTYDEFWHYTPESRPKSMQGKISVRIV